MLVIICMTVEEKQSNCKVLGAIISLSTFQFGAFQSNCSSVTNCHLSPIKFNPTKMIVRTLTPHQLPRSSCHQKIFSFECFSIIPLSPDTHFRQQQPPLSQETGKTLVFVQVDNPGFLLLHPARQEFYNGKQLALHFKTIAGDISQRHQPGRSLSRVCP